METTTMGKVVVTATIENLEDLFGAKKGLVPPTEIRAWRTLSFISGLTLL